MNIRQFLTSAIAATTVVGALGLAYGQSSTDSTTSPQTPAASPAQDSTMTPSQPAQDSTTPGTMPSQSTPSSDTKAAPPASDTTSTPPAGTEPAPKADRN